MTTLKSVLGVTLCLVVGSSRAHADNSDVDVHSFEYLDVVETTDGSIWKGVVVEQTPNVSYKIATADGSLHVIKAGDVVKLTKQKNNDWHESHGTPAETGAASSSSSSSGRATSRDNGVGASYDHGGGLPAPYAKSGFRLDPESTVVFPLGILSDAKVGASFGTGLRAGYEQLFGNFGLGFGALTRITWWQLPSGTMDQAWTLETQAYARASLHIARVAPYAGVALGLDTNYSYASMLDQSNTSLGFGMNVQAGIAIAATPELALDLGADFHPGTDSLNDQSPVSMSAEYFAIHLGASLRL